MITTKICVKNYIEQYITSLYGSPAQFPDDSDIYHTLYDLIVRRPSNARNIEVGNLIIKLPFRSLGKRPETYNYLSRKSRMLVAQKLSLYFWADVHDYLLSQKHKCGIPYITSAVEFLEDHNITTISEDALIKNFYRWQKKNRNRRIKF